MLLIWRELQYIIVAGVITVEIEDYYSAKIKILSAHPFEEASSNSAQFLVYLMLFVIRKSIRTTLINYLHVT